jgi:hypothetical protein
MKSLKHSILELRQKVAENAPEKILGELKGKLPNFTASGIFTERNIPGLIQHSGKMLIDFDKLGDKLNDARAVLCKDKYSEYVFTSCTGRGIGVVVNVDPAKHLESFIYLEKYYLEIYGLQIDKSCKDVSRTRYITYDPDLYAADFFEIVKPESEIATTTVDSDDEKYNWVIACHNKKETFSVGNRHFYLVI